MIFKQSATAAIAFQNKAKVFVQRWFYRNKYFFLHLVKISSTNIKRFIEKA